MNEPMQLLVSCAVCQRVAGGWDERTGWATLTVHLAERELEGFLCVGCVTELALQLADDER